jgi:flagellar motor switch protein FliN/FliY
LSNSGQSITVWLIQEWTDKLAGSVEMMTENRPEVKAGAGISITASEIPADALWFSIPLNVAPDAAILIGATEENWINIGGAALLAAGLDEVGREDARGTYLEIIGQATSGLAREIAVRLETPVASLPPKEVKPGEPGFETVAPLDITLSQPPARRIYLGWSKGLETLLAPPPKPPAAVEVHHASVPPAKHAEPERPRTLDLLLEVELPVSVSFGRAELPLRDVLKLNSGSIVELNRTINDPVEIIVNNCVIARGEVVVVEGNYGVRIGHVVSREERLRTLK